MPETTVLRQTRDFADSRPSRPAGFPLGCSSRRTTVPHRCAFTLIELLVVIAIISLLVSILLPSLNRAKELARIAACQSNLHSIGLAVQVYAGEFDGFLPPHMVNGTGMVPYENVPGNPWRAYAAYWSTWAESMNLAILEERQMIGTGKAFYCPSMTFAGHTWEGDAGDGYTIGEVWEMSPEDRHSTMSSSMGVRTCYMYKPYNPYLWVSGRKYTEAFAVIDNMPPEAVMAVEIAILGDRVAHTDPPSWNLLTADGGTRLSQDDWTMDYITTTNCGNTWGDWNDYSYFRGVLRSLLEH